MAAKVFEKSAEETAFRAVLKEVYESGKNSVAVLWADAALSARFQETLYAFLLKDVLGSAAAGVKLRALCAFCGGEAETAQTEYTHETFIGLMSPITKGENKDAVRLDLFFKKGEAHFIPTLFAYVMNNILGDRFKKAVPDSLDRELEGEDGSMALGASLAGEENTEREVLGEMMSADMVQAVYETLHDRPDELFAFAHKQSEGQMDCKTLLKTLRRLRTPEKVYLDAMALLGAAAQLGIFTAFFGALVFGMTPEQAASIGIIGGADGPTTVFVSGGLSWGWLAAAALALLALVVWLSNRHRS